MGNSESLPFDQELQNYRVISKQKEPELTYLTHKQTEVEYVLRRHQFAK